MVTSFAEIERRWRQYGVCERSYTGMYCKTDGTYGPSNCDLYVQQTAESRTILAGASRFSTVPHKAAVLWHFTQNPKEREELFLLFET